MLSVPPKPRTAWPTICIFVVSTLLSMVSIYMGTLKLELHSFIDNLIYKIFILIATISLSFFSAYSQFTVTHESVHNNISKNKCVNNIIGFLSSLSLGPTGNWFGFKEHHIQHHRETNDPKTDPDMWCSNKGYGGDKYIVLRWLTLDFYYIYAYFMDFRKYSIKTNMCIILNHIFNLLVLNFLIQNYGIVSVMQYWIIPARLAILLLSFAFDYLPHYPHDTIKKENRYKTTSYIACPWIIKLFLSPVSFYQDHHIIHHQDPTIPFYMYSHVWSINKDKFYEKEIRITEIIPSALSPILGKNI